jgi:type I restriction enzyme, R subunit
VRIIRENVTIDWTEKQCVLARLLVMVKRVLRKYDYPPDKQEKAIQQAELLCADWAR